MNYKNNVEIYKKNLKEVLDKYSTKNFEILVNLIEDCWKKNKNIFICGNGGSAGNANHIANDLLYGAGAVEVGEL